MESETERVFGVGADEVGTACGTKLCPAVAAGYNPSRGDRSMAVAEVYDQILTKWHDDGDINIVTDDVTGFGYFVVTEEDAKEAWLNAIGRVEGKNAVVGREIARDLGWL